MQSRFHRTQDSLPALAASLFLFLIANPLAAQEKQPPPQPLQLEEPSVPAPMLEEAEADRRQALTLFGTARKKEQEEQLAEAIRLYQRAHRLDPLSPVILERLVPLLFKQRRMEEGIRYAIRGAQLRIDNPALAQQLALHLTERGNLRLALELYHKLLNAEKPDEQKTPQHVVRLMECGRLSFLLGKHAEAADSFARVLDAIEKAQEFGLNAQARGVLLGDAARTYTMFGEAFLKAGRLQEAAEAFESANSVARDKSSLAFQQARIKLAEQQPNEALAKLQTYFDRKSQSQGLAAYDLLREILEAQGNADQLLARLAALAEQDARNPYLALYRAQRLARIEAWAQAQPLYEAALKELPNDADHRPARIAAQQGLVEAYRRTKQFSPLLDVLAHVVREAEDLDPVAAQVKRLIDDKESLAGVLATAKTRARQDDLPYPGRLAAALLAQEAKLPESHDLYELTLASRPEAAGELFLMWGLGLLFSDKADQAVTVFQRAIDEKAVDEQNPAVHYYLASALALSGKTDEALAAARHAVLLNDESPRLAIRVAWVLYHARRYDDARREYLLLLEKFKDEQTLEAQAARREARLVLSNIDVVQHQLPQAEEWLEQVLDELPDDPTANNDLGYLWADQNKHLRRALRMIEGAVAAEPENKAFLDSLGWVHHRLGNHALAIHYLEKAAAGKDPDGVILDHLGDAYLAANERDKARQAWQKALDKFDKQHETEKLKATHDKLQKYQP